MLYIRGYYHHNTSSFNNSLITFSGKYAFREIVRQDTRIVITQKPKVSALLRRKVFLNSIPLLFPIERFDKILKE
jgi:hypothetical protein